MNIAGNGPKTGGKRYFLTQGGVNFWNLLLHQWYVGISVVCKFTHNRSIHRYKNGSGRDVSPKIPSPMITVTGEYDRLQREAGLICFSAQHLLILLEMESWAKWTTLLFPQGISVFFQFYTLQVVSNILSVVHSIISIADHQIFSALCQIWEYFLDFQMSNCNSATQRHTLQREDCQWTCLLNLVLPKGGDRAVKDHRAVKDSDTDHVRCMLCQSY